MQIDPTNQIITNIKNQVLIQDKIVLDIGCGKGENTRSMAQFAKKVIAIDDDKDMIEDALKLNDTTNLDYIII